MKLHAELVPKSLWGQNLRSHLTKKEWDTLRKRCYVRANHRCEICNGVGRKHPVECHEIWQYDDINCVQKLTGVVALCPACHRVKHIGRTLGTPYKYATLKHFRKVNNVTNYELERYLNTIFGTWSERNLYHWTQDYSELPQIWAGLHSDKKTAIIKKEE